MTVFTDFGGGLTLSQVQAAMPQPAGTAPPPVALTGAPGSGVAYARSDHTHQSKVQARRVQLTFNASGEASYTFPLAYDAGVIPVVETTAENDTAAAYRYDASVKLGSVTNTGATVVLSKTARTITVSVLGAITSLFTNPADTAWIHILSRSPAP